MKTETSSYRYGLWAEWLSAWYLRLRGYKVLARRYKTPVGEVDLIVCKKSALVFVEVKARKSPEDAVQSITKRMQGRITRAAQYYISQNPRWADKEMRFDVITVCPPFFIRHLDNAWLSAP